MSHEGKLTLFIYCHIRVFDTLYCQIKGLGNLFCQIMVLDTIFSLLLALSICCHLRVFGTARRFGMSSSVLRGCPRGPGRPRSPAGATGAAQARAPPTRGGRGLAVYHTYNQRKLGKPQILCFRFLLVTPFHCFPRAFEGA